MFNRLTANLNTSIITSSLRLPKERFLKMKMHDTCRTNHMILTCFVCCMILLASCSPHISNTDMPIEEISDFSNTGTMVLQDKWWHAFEDEQLNRLIDSAMQQNFNLAATWQQFVAANAIVSLEASNKFPQSEVTVQTAENFPLNDFRGGENTQIGLLASYEIDLWGRIRTAVEAENFRAQATHLDYQTAAISLSAEISRTLLTLFD